MEAVDLSNLRETIGDDKELEQELFAEFKTSSSALISDLEQHLQNEATEDWHRASHALKGICLGLGAYPMGETCKIAQEKSDSETAVKQDLLDKIKQQQTEVIAYLDSL